MNEPVRFVLSITLVLSVISGLAVMAFIVVKLIDLVFDRFAADYFRHHADRRAVLQERRDILLMVEGMIASHGELAEDIAVTIRLRA